VKRSKSQTSQTFLRANDWAFVETAIFRGKHNRKSLSEQLLIDDWLFAQDLDLLASLVEYRMERRAKKKADKERAWQEKESQFYKQFKNR
jgi:hypothetical protein